MKDIRIGESLWQQWGGSGYYEVTETELIYFTEDHVDMENEIVRRALASTLQRDGISDSLSDGFKLITDGYVEFGWAGIIEGEKEWSVCDEHGETNYGDFVEDIIAVTWIEI
jgi:hypothetical protein